MLDSSQISPGPGERLDIILLKLFIQMPRHMKEKASFDGAKTLGRNKD
jgi:hypothetical protein